MSKFEKEDLDCINIQKNHGSGSELPVIATVDGKKTGKKKAKKDKPVDAAWTPVEASSSDVANVKDFAIHAAPIAAASVIVFWWQQTGQLLETTGFYSLIALALLIGLNAGKYLMR